MIRKVGYIGLGIMGAAMAENLRRAGFELFVWNRTKSKADDLVARGAAWSDTPADVAGRCEAVCINVTATADVEAVVFGEHGIAGGAGKGLIVIDHSTIDAGATRDFAQRLAGQAIEWLDAPVSGGDVGARNGTLSVMAGGKAEVFERCKRLLEAVGKTVTHCGPVGAGQATKACNQILCAVNLMAVCEALMLAKSEGLDLQTVVKVTGAGAGGSWQLTNLGPKVATGDFAPGFMVELLNKDLGIVEQMAGRHGLPLPGVPVAAALFRAAAKMGQGRAGTQAVAQVYQSLGGVDLAK